jgi:ribokinase
MKSLNVDILASRYRAMLGVGGIGSGVFFALDGNHTLGREESRSGRFIDRRDYCKLHIISHYVKILLGEAFQVLPIGKVGGDEAGQRLLKEMGAAGLDRRHIQTIPGTQTMYSFCFLYPDGSGGNLTTDNSACDLVSEEDVSRAEADFAHYRSAGIALAAPEVPLAARRRLLQFGTKYGFWRVAAFNSAEILPAIEMGLLAEADLLVLNRDEAEVVARIGSREFNGSFLPVVEAVVDRLRTINPHLQVIITAGRDGSWSWDGGNIQHIPAFPVEVASTAGAGDAFLAGVIAGKVAGLFPGEAQELGTLVAAHAVTSPHTIDARLDRQSLYSFAKQCQFALSARVVKILQETQAD